jgi:hypothetical protein
MYTHSKKDNKQINMAQAQVAINRQDYYDDLFGKYIDFFVSIYPGVAGSR